MFLRLLLMGIACFPLLAQASLQKIATCQFKGQASLQKIATCQFKGQGTAHEFMILVDSHKYARAFGNSSAPFALVETNGLSDIPKVEFDQLNAATLAGVRRAEFLLASGTIQLPVIPYSRAAKTVNVSLIVTTDTTVTDGASPLNLLMYTVDGHTITKQLLCADSRIVGY